MTHRILLLCGLIIRTVWGLTISNDKHQKNILENCVCVPFWQCKDDYTGIVDDGFNLIDFRIVRHFRNELAPCTGDYDVCCKIECGTQSFQQTSQRILGSNNAAEFGEFPWMLAIFEGESYRCGGSLIHPRVALTAAHCVSTQGSYKIVAGELSLQNLNQPGVRQEQETKRVIIHPLYHQPSLKNDIALLILTHPFQLTENIGIICLPPPTSNYNSAKCTATGWGKNSHLGGTHQTTLKKVQVPIIPNEECVRSLRNTIMGPRFSLHESFLCAGGELNKDTCKGDGGSPLVCPLRGKPGRYEQVGIVAWGLSCGLANTPGVYVNVAKFSKWIDRELSNNKLDHNIYKA